MKSSTQRLLSIFLSLAFYGVAAFLVFNMSFPAWGRIQTLRAEISEREAVRDQLTDIIAKANELLSRFDDLGRQAEPVSAALPSQPKLPEVLAILNAVAARNNVTISQVTFDDFLGKVRIQRGSSQIPEIRVGVGMVGKYLDLKNWLKGIESELRLMDVRDFSIQPISARPGEDTFAMSVNLVVYYQPKPESLIPQTSQGAFVPGE
jgi:Tfp pilus assembly protein PilO